MRPRRAARRCFFLLVLLQATFALELPQARAAGTEADSLEYGVKAAYLYKLGDYIEWPAAAFDSPTSPVQICIAGADPFGGSLDATVSGEHVKGRPIAIRKLRLVERNSGCHIVYFGGSDQQSASQGLALLQGTPVLTVTDAARNSDAAGIVHFVTKANRVRFDIDDQAAAQNGLTISSKLFGIAASVKLRK